MDDESSKLFNFYQKRSFQGTDIPPNAKIISINIDIDL